MMIKVSIVLPSLNVATYIRECMESVLAQTLQEIEVICVDAGSEDGTREIIEEFALADSRVRVLTTDRRSYGYQVNLGMDQAHGKYVGIVETDDLVPPEMYAELYAASEENQADLVKADFYRFKDSEGQRNKVLEKLSPRPELYGKVINPRECKDVFNFPLNTWSGIYKLSFLRKHNIRHNESPGASFQDNGFWFQTFIHANRAYFVDKAYYLNRRDNPASSVYSTGKIFAMADEYDFLQKIMKENPRLKKEFWRQYVRAKINGYFHTLRRVTYTEKLEFLPRFAREVRIMVEKHELHIGDFSDVELGALFRIAFAEKDYEELYIRPRLELYDKIRRSEGAIIYGAGKYGRIFFDDLYRDVPGADVIGFAVSDASGKEIDYRGVKIYGIDELEHHKHKLVVLALGERNRQEVLPLLAARQFDNIELLPPMVFPLM